MRPQPGSSNTEVLAGLVERVTYHNSENGFCVLRAKVRGHRDMVTVVGHAAAIAAGEWITASGDWVNDRTHGQQFKARFLRTSPPTSADGIEKYLSSGMIRGVGPVYANKLVRAFGDKVFDVIEATPDRLREVDGIGPVRAASILAAWAEQKAVREIMVFLHSHGVGTARAVRIFFQTSANHRPDHTSRLRLPPLTNFVHTKSRGLNDQVRALFLLPKQISRATRWHGLRQSLSDGLSALSRSKFRLTTSLC
jgi:Helix-hairpin-helix domain